MMKRLRRLFTYLVPHIELITSSPFNPEIRVLVESGEYKLLVNGSRQSGRYIRDLWQYAIDAMGVGAMRNVKRIAVLGVAGGTVIHLLHEMFPEASITGVDIDQVMIDLGKRYFGLAGLPLTTVTMDAQDFIARQKEKKYDLIIIDLFIGREIPSFVQSEAFLKKLPRLLRPGGAVLINFLREHEYGKRADAFAVSLKKIWKTVSSAERDNNRFFFAV